MIKGKTLLIIGIIVACIWYCNSEDYTAQPKKIDYAQAPHTKMNNNATSVQQGNNGGNVKFPTPHVTREPIKCNYCEGTGICSLCNGTLKIRQSEPKSINNRCPCVYQNKGKCSGCKGRGYIG